MVSKVLQGSWSLGKKAVESKSQSRGQDNSHVMSENSMSPAEILEGFQQCIKEIFKLIGQDVNFSELTVRIYDSKESKSTKPVMELSRVHGRLADQNENSTKEVSENTHYFQTSKQNEFATAVDFEINFNSSGGGFRIFRSEGSESAISKSSDSKSESLTSINKNPNSPVKKEESKAKQIKVPDSKGLHKKISTPEKEQLSLQKKIQDLKSEKALLEAEKSNVAELKLTISESNRNIETMEKVIEESREQILTADNEILKPKQELSRNDFDSQIMSENVEVIELESSGKLGFHKCVEEILKLTNLDETISEMTVEIYHCENSKLTTRLNELRKSVADQTVDLEKEVSKTPGGGFNVSPVKKDESMGKQTKVQDSKELQKKVSTLEKEQLSLKKTIQDLKDENALLEAQKSNVADLELKFRESNRQIEIMRSALEGSRTQVKTAEGEISKLKQKLSRKELDQNKYISVGETITSLEKQLDSRQARDLEMHEMLNTVTADIKMRDDKIRELNAEIVLLRISHAADEDKRNADVERLKTELRERDKLIDDLNQKHDELKLKVVELERELDTQREVMAEEKREVIRQLSVTVDHYMSECKQLRQSLLGYQRRHRRYIGCGFL